MKKVKLSTLLITLLSLTSLVACNPGEITSSSNNSGSSNQPSASSAIELTAIALNKTETSILLNSTETLTVTFTPNNATDKEVEWSSDDATIASVENGVVTAKKIGVANITVKSKKNTSISATCKVTVTENTSIVKPTGITLNKSSLELMSGETGQLSATVKPADATNKTVTWSSDNTAVATVGNGTVTAVGEGTATITASTFNGFSASCTVTVTPKQFTTIDHGIYFEKPSDWDEAWVYLFENNATVGTAWPGTKMKDMGDGVYCLEYTTTSSNLMLVFNNGNKGKQSGADIAHRLRDLSAP